MKSVLVVCIVAMLSAIAFVVLCADIRDPLAIYENHRRLRTVGRRAEATKDIDKRISDAENFITDNPGHDDRPWAELSLALLYGTCGKDEFGKSEEILLSILEKHDGHEILPWAEFFLADLYSFGVLGNNRVREGREILSKMSSDYSGTDWEPRVKLLQALSYYHFTWDSVRQGDDVFREHAVRLFREVADEYPDTMSGAFAAYKLACHHAFFKTNLAMGRDYAFRVLRFDPAGNAYLYHTAVKRLMDDEAILLKRIKSETLRKARGVIRGYPGASSSRRSRFITRVGSWYYSDWVAEEISKIIEYARERNRDSLLREAVMLQSMVYLCKERPRECIEYIAEAIGEHGGLLTESDHLLLQDYLAVSYLWMMNYERAGALFRQLSEKAPESPDEGTSRTKSYYLHWSAVSLFLDGRIDESIKLFEKIESSYPASEWGRRSNRYISYAKPLSDALSTAGR